ncbi:hypothetical protein OG735_41175 (plasmid) [Streptomyces sp. NBC_01210]|nr:hypothetical protein OG735_41175 [Streptomyces sp. NBC_01210]
MGVTLRLGLDNPCRFPPAVFVGALSLLTGAIGATKRPCCRRW